jgi:hypothetical protein
MSRSMTKPAKKIRTSFVIMAYSSPVERIGNGFSPDAAPGGSGNSSPCRAGARVPSGFGCRKLLEKVTVGTYPGDGRERQAARDYTP